MPTDIIIDELRKSHWTVKEISDMWQAQYKTGRHETRRESEEGFDGKSGVWYSFDFLILEEKITALEDHSGWDIP